MKKNRELKEERGKLSFIYFIKILLEKVNIFDLVEKKGSSLFYVANDVLDICSQTASTAV